MPYVRSIEPTGLFAIGKRDGLVKGIEAAVDIRFGAAGLALLPEIQAVEDVKTLEAVLKAIKTVGTPEELRAFCRPPASSGSGS
jgi:hypothetical protein